MLKRFIIRVLEVVFFTDPVIHFVDKNYATTYKGSHRMSYAQILGRD